MALNVLITGSDGLLGSHLEKILSRTCNVFSVTRRSNNLSIEGNIQRIFCDLSCDGIRSQLPSKIDVVFHLAQSRKFRSFPLAAEDIYKVNILSTINLLSYSLDAGVKKFIFASTGGVYQNSRAKISETSLLKQAGAVDAYVGSKLCGEILSQSYAPHIAINVVRPFFVYGPGQSAEMLLPRLINRVLLKESINLVGPDGMVFNPIHVDDASFALSKLVLSKETGVFNIAGPEVVSLRSVVKKIGDVTGLDVSFQTSDETLSPTLVADIEKMETHLMRPTSSIMDYIKNYVF